MGVDQGGSDILMPEEFPHGPDSAFRLASGGGVPKE
jgi:hypothetical protein